MQQQPFPFAARLQLFYFFIFNCLLCLFVVVLIVVMLVVIVCFVLAVLLLCVCLLCLPGCGSISLVAVLSFHLPLRLLFRGFPKIKNPLKNQEVALHCSPQTMQLFFHSFYKKLTKKCYAKTHHSTNGS